MEAQPKFQKVPLLRAFVKATALIAINVGLCVLAGWFLDIPLLRSLLLGAPPTKVGTAFGFLFAGIAVWLLQDVSSLPNRKRLGNSLAVLVIVIGTWNLFGHLFQWNLSIDRLLWELLPASTRSLPWKMSPVTALSLTLIGLALLWIDARISQYLVLGVTALSMVAVVGYLYNYEALYELPGYGSIAVLTALALLVLSLGILAARPDLGIMHLLTSTMPAARTIRFMLPLMIGAIVLLGFVVEIGEKIGLIVTGYESVVLVILVILIFSPMIYIYASQLNRSEVRIIHLSRLYATLSQVSQTIVRVQSKQELFDSICKVAVEFGGASIAWVGLLNESTGDIELVSAKGTDLTHWTPLALNIHHGDYQNSLPAIAVRTSRVTTEETETDPVTSQRHAELAKRGYKSLAAIPLRLREKTIGVFGLLSAEAGIFKAGDERQLLEEMGQDISFALDMMETEAERQRAEGCIRYQAGLLENVSDAIIASGMDARITSWNSAAAEIYGWRAEEVLGKTLEEILHTTYEDNGSRERALRQILQYDSWKGEVTQERKDGKKITILASVSLIRDQEGTPSAMVAVNRDISERKEAEEELRNSEERFNKAFNASPNALVMIRIRDGQIQTINHTFESFFGYSKEEVIGKSSVELQMFANPAERQAAIQQLQRDQFVRNFEMHVRLKSGEVRTVTLSIEIVNIGGENMMFTMIEDITERKLAEDALRENEERLRLSLQAANQGLYDLNVQTGEAIVNREYAQMLGYDPETFVETNAAWIERLHPDDREITANAYSDYLQGILPEYQVEFRQRTRDGNWKWILSLGKVIEHDAEGKPLRMLGTHTDITGRKQAEEEIQSKSHQLAALLEASQSLTGSLNLAEILQKITDTSAQILGLETAALYLAEGEQLYLGASTPPLPPDFPEALRTAALADHPHIAEALFTAKPVLVTDALSASWTAAEQSVRDALGLRTILYIPLAGKKNAEGVLILASIGDLREFHSNEKDLACTLSNQAVLAIANARLYEDLARYVKELERQGNERKKAQEMFYRVVESAPNAILLVGADGRLRLVNAQVENYFGYDRAELIGMDMNLLIPERFRESHRLQSRNFIANAHTRLMGIGRDLFGLRKDGTEFPAEIGLTALELAEEALVMVTIVDITVRKQAEKALRKSEERFRLLFENNHTIMLLIDPVSGTIRSANQAAAKFYGYALPELCAMNINDINSLTPDDVYKERMRALQEERNYFVFQHRLSDDRIRTVEVHSAPIEVEGNSLLFSIVYDITDRRYAEEKLRRHINYLTGLREVDQAIASSFDVRLSLNIITSRAVPLLNVDAAAILILDPVMNVLEYESGNGFLTKVSSSTSIHLTESYAGRAVLERRMVHIPNLRHEPSNLFSTGFLKDENFVSYDGVPLIVKGKVVGVMEVFHRNVVDRDQEWFGFLDSLAGQAAIAIDNARLWQQVQRHARDLELRVAERTAALNRTNAELEHANRAKDEFLANMSHELRTPLNSILGLSESLLEQRRDPLTDYQQRSLEIVSSSGHHLLELINDILDLSKIEAGKFDYYPQVVEVDALCRSSLTLIRSQAVRKSIAVNYENDTSVPSIIADPRRLKQILVNLLTNAVKFTPEGGQVTLQVRADSEQELMEFSVLDTGIGIDQQDLKRLFQPFVQLDSKLNRQFEGTGLGLALVHKLTDMHGGSVHVESTVGSGSRFTIKLPGEKITDHRILPQGVGQREQSTISGLPPGSQLVLLVDDHVTNITTIAEYLESHGYRTLQAHDGMEAIEKAKRYTPDIILMDIQMPVIDGLEATRQLRSNPRSAAIPIIAITALAMPGDLERCLEAGANAYLSKPIRLKVLKQTVETLLQNHASN